MKQVRIVREAYERGELTADERSKWLLELQRSRSMFSRLYDYLLG